MVADEPDVTGGARPPDETSRYPLEILTALIENIPAAVFAKDAAGRYVVINAAVERQFGRTRDEILGRTDNDLVPPAVAAAFLENDQRAMETGAPIETTSTGALPNGPVTYRTVKFPLGATEAGPLGVGGVSIDLSDRRWTETVMLAELGALLGEWRDSPSLVAGLTQIVANHFDLDRCFIADLDVANGQLIVRHEHQRGETLAPEVATTAPFEPWVVAALGAGRTVVQGASLRAEQPDLLAYLVIPLRREGQPVAVLAAFARAPRFWTGGEVALAETIAQRAWLAIENARLLRETTTALRERDAMLTALAKSEAHFRQLTENIDNAVFWVTDLPSRQVRYVSPSYERLWGFRVVDLLADGRRWIASVHADDRARVERVFTEEAVRGGFDIEYRLDLPDGRVRWIHDRGYPLTTSDDGQTRITGIAEDITDRREREERAGRLQALTAALAGAADPSTVAAAILEHILPALGASAGVVLQVQQGAASVTRPTFTVLAQRGYSAATVVLGQPIPSNYPSPLADAVARRAPIVFRSHAERMARYPELGDERPAATAGAGVSLPLIVEGRPVGAFGLSFSTTRRFPAEEMEFLATIGSLAAQALDRARLLEEAQTARAAAEDAQSRYRSLFEGAGDAILIADLDGRLRDGNPALLRLLGYSRTELLKRRISELMAGDLTRLEGEYSRFLRDGAWQGEHVVRRADGTALPVESRARIVSTPAGPVQWMALRDVSERKEVEQEQQAFLSSVSHDLKNPLSVIKGQAQYLRRRLRRGGPPDPGRLERGLATIEETVERAAELIQELSDVARLKSGHTLELHRQLVDLVAIVRNTAESYRRLSDRHPIHVESDERQLAGLFDSRRIERVIGNLLTNAIKYSPDGGEIVIRLRREQNGDGERALVAVRDRGVGIPSGDLDHVFERYRRGTNVRGIAGSGIGLAGVRQIVEQHGGTISVESRQGVGSTFTVRLPLGRSSGRGGGSTVTG